MSRYELWSLVVAVFFILLLFWMVGNWACELIREGWDARQFDREQKEIYREILKERIKERSIRIESGEANFSENQALIMDIQELRSLRG